MSAQGKADSDTVISDVWKMVKRDDWIASSRPFAEVRAVIYGDPDGGITKIQYAPRFDGNTSAIFPQNEDGSKFADMIPMNHVIGLAPRWPS